MTLATCRLRLEIAKKYENADEIKFWEDRIAHKLGRPEYAAEPEEESEEEDAEESA
tara:strand:+ start:1601 stop:1768 length:168 start_codon:yes stop_codon:yes gene_type:complete